MINDNKFFKIKADDLKKFNFKIYFINKDNEIIVSNEMELHKKYHESIEIEKENIYPYLFVMNSQITEITNDDLLY